MSNEFGTDVNKFDFSEKAIRKILVAFLFASLNEPEIFNDMTARYVHDMYGEISF